MIRSYSPDDYWSVHPHFTVADWQAEVANGDTRTGYHEWVEGQMELQMEAELSDIKGNT